MAAATIYCFFEASGPNRNEWYLGCYRVNRHITQIGEGTRELIACVMQPSVVPAQLIVVDILKSTIIFSHATRTVQNV